MPPTNPNPSRRNIDPAPATPNPQQANQQVCATVFSAVRVPGPTVKLPLDILAAIRRHAEAACPEECCGVAFCKRSQHDELIRLKRCTNAQDKFHEMDPINFPRTNREAYFIDPRDLLAIEQECRDDEVRVRLIYHSHPDAGAYFSEEDQRRAVVDGGPLHAGVDYLVVSVRNGKAGDMKLFKWDASSKTFVGRGT